MKRLPPRSNRTDTHVPYPTLFRSRRRDNEATATARRRRAPARRADRRNCRPAASPTRRPSRRPAPNRQSRSEEHTSELQSLMRISYAVFCLKKKKKKRTQNTPPNIIVRSTHINESNIQLTITLQLIITTT